MSKQIRVVVATPDNLARIGLCTILNAQADVSVVAETAEIQTLSTLCELHQPQIILIADEFTFTPLLDCVLLLRHKHTASDVLMVVPEHIQSQHLSLLLQAGVAGVLLRSDSAQSITSAVCAVTMGGRWLNAKVMNSLITSSAVSLNPAMLGDTLGLTEREREVVQLIAKGWNNDQIAQALGIRERTVRFHLRNIYDKYHLHSRSEAIVWALQHPQTLDPSPLQR